MSLVAREVLRQASTIAIVAGAVLAPASFGLGQDLVLPELRRGTDAPSADELRSTGPAAPGAGTRPALPGNSAFLDRPAGEPSDSSEDPEAFEEAEEDAPAADIEPTFDLFEGPEEAADAPTVPVGLVSDPAVVAPFRPAAQANRAGEAATPDLPADEGFEASLPIGAVKQPRLDGLGRVNLPVAGSIDAGPRSEDDPFAPVGLRAGRFVLYSTLEQSLGYSSNLDGIPEGEEGGFSDTAVSARLLSDWSRHEAEINALAAYRRNFAGEARENPRAAADARLRLDVDRDTTATLRGAFEYRREDAAELDDLAALADRPDVLNASGSAEIERHFGRAVLGLTGSAAREAYFTEAGNVPEESYSTFTAALRGGYEISPALQPFVEASLGRRVFDQEEDAEGRSRASLIQTVRAGIVVDFGEKLRGEAAVGYARNVPEDESLPDNGTPTFDARLDWSPQRGTDVTLLAATSFEPDSSNLSTTVLYETALDVRHRLNSRTEVTAGLSAGYSDSDIAGDDEVTYGAETGFTYWVNRALALTGLVSHQRLRTETGEGDYSATTAQLGIRLQR